jgi:hypothetical protein
MKKNNFNCSDLHQEKETLNDHFMHLWTGRSESRSLPSLRHNLLYLTTFCRDLSKEKKKLQPYLPRNANELNNQITETIAESTPGLKVWVEL